MSRRKRTVKRNQWVFSTYEARINEIAQELFFKDINAHRITLKLSIVDKIKRDMALLG